MSVPKNFGDFGGMFVSETLVEPLNDLTKQYKKAMCDPSFHEEIAVKIIKLFFFIAASSTFFFVVVFWPPVPCALFLVGVRFVMFVLMYVFFFNCGNF